MKGNERDEGGRMGKAAQCNGSGTADAEETAGSPLLALKKDDGQERKVEGREK